MNEPGQPRDPHRSEGKGWTEERLRARTRGLPSEIEPTRDLWPGIAARIAAEGMTPDDVSGTGTAPDEGDHDPHAGTATDRRARWAVAGERMALVAALLVLVLAGWHALAPDGRSDRGPAGDPGSTLAARPAPVLAALDELEAECRQARETLQSALAVGGGTASAEVYDVLQSNLAIIQLAIAETRDAVRRHPHDPEIATYLAHGLYADELALIRTGARLVTPLSTDASEDAGQKE